MDRLRAKFAEFHQNRELLRDMLGDYILDYRQVQGNTLQRQEALREKYSHSAPMFSHLVWSDDDTERWTAADIAVVLGREKSSITRTLAKLEHSEGWCSRLLAIRHTDKSANGLTIYSYDREIFELIVDRYEEEYLQRFADPRHGEAKDIDEIRRFWEYLHQSAESQRMKIASHEEHELPEIPPMRWQDIASLIWRRIFTVRTGTFFGIIFALSFELAGRWALLKSVFLTGGFALAAGCAVMIRRHKWRIDVLADLGAGALLFGLLWIAGLGTGSQHHSPAMTNRDILMNDANSWVQAYRLQDMTLVTVNPLLYSELAEDVEALEYGINTEPDTRIPRSNLKDYHDEIISTHDDSIKFVTSRLIFTDGSTSPPRKDIPAK